MVSDSYSITMTLDVGEEFQLEIGTEATSMKFFTLFQSKNSFLLPTYQLKNASYDRGSPGKGKWNFSKEEGTYGEKFMIGIPNYHNMTTEYSIKLQFDGTGIGIII